MWFSYKFALRTGTEKGQGRQQKPFKPIKIKQKTESLKAYDKEGADRRGRAEKERESRLTGYIYIYIYKSEWLPTAHDTNDIASGCGKSAQKLKLNSSRIESPPSSLPHRTSQPPPRPKCNSSWLNSVPLRSVQGSFSAIRRFATGQLRNANTSRFVRKKKLTS